MNKETKGLDIDKKQIQVAWDCIKEVVDLHCRIPNVCFAFSNRFFFSFSKYTIEKLDKLK